MIKQILINNGYTVVRKYQGHNPDYRSVFLVRKANNEYFAKYFKSGVYSWDEYKEIYSTMHKLGFAPAIEEFIDIDNKSGIIINLKFGESYYRHLRNSSYYDIIKPRVDELHNSGYIHGDMNSCNILIDTANNQVMFIDFNNCFHKSDSRLLAHVKTIYGVDNFEDACKHEIEDITFVPN